jgi:hypothetical protein
MDYGARFYDPALGRFASADSVVPEPGNPQALNRYAYVLGNPLRYVDPTGHDPFTEEWFREFEKQAGRQAQWFDRMAYLFSIAFPDELRWDPATMANAEVTKKSIETLFKEAPRTRDWNNMPAATQNLAARYENHETMIFTRDIGSLFAGLGDRFDERYHYKAIVRAQLHQGVQLQGAGVSPHLLDGDSDANVHHWAAFVLLGHYAGGLAALGWNFTRELSADQRKLPDGSIGPVNRADIAMGSVAAFIGGVMPHSFRCCITR